MIITEAKYYKDFPPTKVVGIQATWDEIEHSVPLDSENTDYAEIMRQVDAGELTIEPADE